MANDFDEVRLPEDIERGTVGGPGFNTTVVSLANGGEQRNQEWSDPRAIFNIGYGIQKRSDLEAVYAFFHARAGMARGFRFRNWLDYKVVYNPVGIVPGEPLQRQLVRVYADALTPYIKRIVRPVEDTVKVYVNSVITEAYVLTENGLLVFDDDPGLDVVASFEFDYPVRFDTDRLDVQLQHLEAGAIPSIQIVELVK